MAALPGNLQRGGAGLTHQLATRAAIYLVAGLATFTPEWLLIAVRHAPEAGWPYLSYAWRATLLATLPVAALLGAEVLLRALVPDARREAVWNEARAKVRSPLGSAEIHAGVFGLFFMVAWAFVVSMWVDLDLPVKVPGIQWQAHSEALYVDVPIAAAVGILFGLAIFSIDRLRRPDGPPWYCTGWPWLGFPLALLGTAVLPARVLGFWNGYHPIIAVLTFAGFVTAISLSPRARAWLRPLARPATVWAVAVGAAGSLLLLGTRLAQIPQEPLALLDANRPLALTALGRLRPTPPVPGYTCPGPATGLPAVDSVTGDDVVIVSVEALSPSHVLQETSGEFLAPRMATLANAGTWFSGAVSPGPRTAFGVVGLIQSRSMQCTSPLPEPGEPTLFRILDSAGYQTAHIGGFPLGIDDFTVVPHAQALEAGIDHISYVLEDSRRLMMDPLDHRVADRAADYLERASPDRPLALWVHFINPHHTYNPPKDLLGTRGRGRLARYEEEIVSTDRQLGALFDALHRSRPRTRKILVVAGDHGQALHPLGPRYHGSDVIQEMVHTYLAISAPDMPPGVVDRPVSLIDVPATVLDLLGLAAPASFQGRSLVPLMRGEPLPDVPIRLDNAMWADHSEAVISGGYKLIRRLRPRFRGVYPEAEVVQLFDLTRDAAERNNLAEDRRDVVRALYPLLPREYFPLTEEGW